MPGEAVAGKPEKQDSDTNKALLPGGGLGPPPWSEQKFAIATAGGGGGGGKVGHPYGEKDRELYPTRKLSPIAEKRCSSTCEMIPVTIPKGTCP